MGAEIGHFALILALLLAIAQAGFGAMGHRRLDPALMAAANVAAIAQAGFVVLAFGLLMQAFAVHDFSVALVASHSHSQQPFAYRLAATWGNHEGSMLLWALILSGFSAMVAAGGSAMRPGFHSLVVAVLGLLAIAFIAFVLFTSNPFARLFPAPLEGSELNPLLQDPGLVLHPPLLYVGYVGFSVAFAFATAALIEGRVDAAWARWVRPWILAAWVALTLGITLGSHWAYYELGWGGWWFWDPVENAALLPWLLGTALLHSALVLEKRGALISWTILLAILTFSMSMVGTFLVRSGVLTSVHAFAVDPERGFFILLLIAISTGSALALFAWRAPGMRSGAMFAPISRESALTLNNLFLMAATLVVFLGTFWPLVIDLATGNKISVGPPYYNRIFAPMMIPFLVLLPFGPMLRWKSDDWRAVAAHLKWPMLLAILVLLAAAAATFATFGWRGLGAALGFSLTAWLVAGSAAVLVRRWRGNDGFSIRLVRSTPLSTYGMVAGHAGIGIMVAGITAMAVFATSQVAALGPGESSSVGGRTVKLERAEMVQGPNYQALRAHFLIEDGGRIRPLLSERRLYPASGTTTTEPGIASGLGGITYVAIGDETNGKLAVHMWRHPLVGWIWGGALIVSLGGALALADRRFRAGMPALPRAAVPA